jgi:hypothetical protein
MDALPDGQPEILLMLHSAALIITSRTTNSFMSAKMIETFLHVDLQQTAIAIRRCFDDRELDNSRAKMHALNLSIPIFHAPTLLDFLLIARPVGRGVKVSQLGSKTVGRVIFYCSGPEITWSAAFVTRAHPSAIIISSTKSH